MEWKDFIKNIRKELSLSQSQFAEMIGLPVNTLRGWEYGNALPNKFYCDLFFNVYENIDLVRDAIEKNRLSVPKIKPKRNKEVSLGKTITKVAVGTGIAYGIFKLLEAIFKENKE